MHKLRSVIVVVAVVNGLHLSHLFGLAQQSSWVVDKPMSGFWLRRIKAEVREDEFDGRLRTGTVDADGNRKVRVESIAPLFAPLDTSA